VVIEGEKLLVLLQCRVEPFGSKARSTDRARTTAFLAGSRTR
jgi:hypothetical protein